MASRYFKESGISSVVFLLFPTISYYFSFRRIESNSTRYFKKQAKATIDAGDKEYLAVKAAVDERLQGESLRLDVEDAVGRC
jgi:hypothetical protein